MKNAKHTPAPWNIENTVSIVNRDHEGDDWDIAEVYETNFANAHLISAAPDLLAALEGLLADITDYQTINNLGGENNHWQVMACAAINKAKGQP